MAQQHVAHEHAASGGHAVEGDVRLLAYQAVGAVGADQILCAQAEGFAFARAGHHDAVRILLHLSDQRAAHDGHVFLQQALLQQAFGATLRQEQGVGVGRVDAGKVETAIEAREMPAGERFAQCREALVQAPQAQHFQGAAMDGQRARLRGPLRAPLQHGHVDACQAQFAGEGQSHGTGPHNDDFGMRVVHEIPI